MSADVSADVSAEVSRPESALIIGGGGVAGIAWALGILTGCVDAGIDLSGFGHIVGTSAGATVGAQLLTDRLDRAFESQYRPSPEIVVDLDLEEYQRRIGELIIDAPNGAAARAAIGMFALTAATVSESERRAVVAHRLDGADWPVSGARLTITAVDVATGDLETFTAGSGVALIDAVAASCAVPGVWPPVTLRGRRYMDGGMRSLTNADLARPCGARFVIVPTRVDERARARLQRDLHVDAEHGQQPTVVVEPDDRALAAIGRNPFDPEVRAAAASSGRAQAARLAPGWAARLGG